MEWKFCYDICVMIMICSRSYQKQKPGDGLDLSVGVPFRYEGEVKKQDAHDSSHGCSTDQENVVVLEFLRLAEFEDEAVVDPRLSPHDYVASVEEDMQEQQAKNAAQIQTSKLRFRYDQNLM